MRISATKDTQGRIGVKRNSLHEFMQTVCASKGEWNEKTWIVSNSGGDDVVG